MEQPHQRSANQMPVGEINSGVGEVWVVGVQTTAGTVEQELDKGEGKSSLRGPMPHGCSHLLPPQHAATPATSRQRAQPPACSLVPNGAFKAAAGKLPHDWLICTAQHGRERGQLVSRAAWGGA